MTTTTTPEVADRPTAALWITVAHHGDDEIYEIGRIYHETTPQQLWDFLRADLATECCTAADSGHDLCFLVDQALDAGDFWDLGDSREVTQQQATDLLGYDVMPALEGARARLAAYYATQKSA